MMVRLAPNQVVTVKTPTDLALVALLDKLNETSGRMMPSRYGGAVVIKAEGRLLFWSPQRVGDKARELKFVDVNGRITRAGRDYIGARL